MADPFGLQTDVARQYTVPRFLLKHFSMPGKGKWQRSYVSDKAAGRAYATTPDDAIIRNMFYNLDNHPDRLSLEPLLGIYEHHAAPVITALSAHRDIRRLADDGRYRLAVFVAVQCVRIFDGLERISGMISVLTDKIEAIGSTKEQAMETPGLSSRGDTKDIFLQQLVQQVSHIDLLLKKDWYLPETGPERPFYVSNDPAAPKNSNDSGPYGNLGLTVSGIQIYLPLSSTLMLAMYCPFIREQMVRQKWHLQHLLARAPHLIPRHIRPLERLEYIRRYTDYLLMPLTPEHVMHYNSLQMEFAEQYVSCGEKDFSLVEKMLADSERYRTGPWLMF